MSSSRVETSADVSEQVALNDGAQVWHLAQVSEGAILGRNSSVGRGAYIGTGVRVSKIFKIQNYALLYEPAEVEDRVFIGPAIVPTNDTFPRAVTPTGEMNSGAGWQPLGWVGKAGVPLIAGEKVWVCPGPVEASKKVPMVSSRRPRNE